LLVIYFQYPLLNGLYAIPDNRSQYPRYRVSVPLELPIFLSCAQRNKYMYGACRGAPNFLFSIG